MCELTGDDRENPVDEEGKAANEGNAEEKEQEEAEEDEEEAEEDGTDVNEKVVEWCA